MNDKASSKNDARGGQRKYDGVDFTIVISERRRWHIYITKNKIIGDQSPGRIDGPNTPSWKNIWFQNALVEE